VFIGTVDALVEECFELRKMLGISYIAVTGNMEGFAPIVQRMAGVWADGQPSTTAGLIVLGCAPRARDLVCWRPPGLGAHQSGE
jgi:hypothetical protein